MTAVVPMAEGLDTLELPWRVFGQVGRHGSDYLAKNHGMLVGHVGGAWAELGWSVPPIILGRSSSRGGCGAIQL